jgi:hypothetical protein
MSNFEPTLVNILIIVSISFGLLLVGVIITYFWLVKKYLSLEHDKAKSQAEIVSQSQKILQDAQASANQIVKEASLKAESIIKGANEFNASADQVITHLLEAQSHNYLAAYQKALDSLEQGILNQMKAAPGDVKKGIQDQLLLVGENLSKELTGTQNEFRNALENTYKSMQVDLDKYKKAKLAKVDESIVNAIEEIAKVVIAKTIPIEEHEELVVKALDQAKKEGLFN